LLGESIDDPNRPPEVPGRNSGAGSADSPRADTFSRYYDMLQESAENYPLATEALMRADRHRPRRWQQFIDPVDIHAIDLLLGFLKASSDALAAESASHDLDFLPTRIADDVRMSLEGVLSGYLQVASDAMRDVIETELLIRDFALDPRQIDRWRNADERLLRRDFQPVRCRERQANALCVHIDDVPGATDYAAHSKLLHAGPPLLFARSPESGHRAIYLLNAVADILVHGISAVEALVLLFRTINVSGPAPGAPLVALQRALGDLTRARAATEGMERSAAESLWPSKEGAVQIFENGLVISIGQDASEVDLYRTNRIDFRQFHRGVSDQQSASFELSPLQDTEDAS
jgi:hypothetical protein